MPRSTPRGADAEGPARLAGPFALFRTKAELWLSDEAKGRPERGYPCGGEHASRIRMGREAGPRALGGLKLIEQEPLSDSWPFRVGKRHSLWFAYSRCLGYGAKAVARE